MTSPAQSALQPISEVAVARSKVAEVRVSDYVRVGVLLTLYCIGLRAVVQTAVKVQPAAASVMAPMFAMFALTGVVFLIMVVVRNATVLRGITSPTYYLAYVVEPPPDWVERPARTFNNLMQVPPLFYVVCSLMLISGRFDQAQVALAWIFVATRALHALVYIGWNYLPLRFATFVASFITLAVLWTRLALQV